MFESKIICPICKAPLNSVEAKHRHMEENHNNVAGKNTELMEKTAGKELLNE